MNKNIFPTDSILQREDKEKLLKQRGKVISFTGLTGSGKTTIAVALEKELNKIVVLTQILDGDNIRAGINKNLGFSDEDRAENIRRVAETAKLFLNCGVVTICCFVSPTEAVRKQAKEIIGEPDFLEVFINTPVEICKQRDVKGLYAKAKKGEIQDFTGVNAPFEAPANPDIEVNTEDMSVNDCAEKILKSIQK